MLVYGSYLEVYGLFIAFEAMFYAIATAIALKTLRYLLDEYDRLSSQSDGNDEVKQIIENGKSAVRKIEFKVENRIPKFRIVTVLTLLAIGLIAYISLYYNNAVISDQNTKEWFEDFTYWFIRVFGLVMLFKIIAYYILVQMEMNKIKEKTNHNLEMIRDAKNKLEKNKNQLERKS